MNKLIIKKLLLGTTIKVHVRGESMEPVLREGDIITIRKKEYRKGDILLFIYEGKELLVHRLLKITDNYCYCKGDNSFRLEQISKNDVLGAVEAINENAVLNSSLEFLEESKLINDIYIMNNCDIEKVKKTREYKEYYKKYLSRSLNG